MNTSITTDKNSPIGFFDSGVGGLTVYSKFREKLQNENCIYFGDTEHIPYGNKTKAQLISYAESIMDFYKTKKVKAVVIACNTSSAAAYDSIKDKYDFKIYPMIQSCAKVIAELPYKKLGIFATQATINSGIYEQEIKKYNDKVEIFSQSCPQWVNIVETKAQEDPVNIQIIHYDLEIMMQNHPEKIILGCTHYPYLIDNLSKDVPRDLFIDPAEYFVDYVINDLKNADLLSDSIELGDEKMYVSSNPKQFQKAAKMFYMLQEPPILI